MKSNLKLNSLLLAMLFAAGSSFADPSSDENLLRRRPLSLPDHNSAESAPAGGNSRHALAADPDMKQSGDPGKLVGNPAGYWNSALSGKDGTDNPGIKITDGRTAISGIRDHAEVSGPGAVSSSDAGSRSMEHVADPDLGVSEGSNSGAAVSGSQPATGSESGSGTSVSPELTAYKSSQYDESLHGNSGPEAASGSADSSVSVSDLQADNYSGNAGAPSDPALSSGAAAQSRSRSRDADSSAARSDVPVHDYGAGRRTASPESLTAAAAQSADHKSGSSSGNSSQRHPRKPAAQLRDGSPAEQVSIVSRTDSRSASGQSKSVQGASRQQSGSLDLNRENIITVRRGVNEIIPVSLGYVNRIVTPFAHPEVVSSSVFSSADSCEEFCIRGNVIYITTSDSRPVAMFVTEQGRPEKSISITMIPKQIPPREVIFRFPAGEETSAETASAARGSDAAMRFERSSDYITSIKKILKSAALNRIPEGYELHVTGEDQTVPFCEQSGLHFSFRSPGQYMKGYHFSVYIGVVTNRSDHEIEFDETSCSAPDVAAVAAWPKIYLFPGDKTELFIVRRLYHESGSEELFRPNLLRGQ